MEFYPTNYHDKTISDLVEDLKTIQYEYAFSTYSTAYYRILLALE